MNQPIETTFEIVPADLGLDLTAKNSLELAFQGFFATAAEWKEKAALITDPKEARSARLEMKNLRVAVEKKHKEMKADSLLFGRAVDGAKNIFLAMATPIERDLDDIEKAEERAAAARIAALQQERMDILETIDYETHGINLGMMREDAWHTYLTQAKDAYQARKDREQKAKEEAEAAAKKEAEEREAQRRENIRLKAEAEAREKELAEERRVAAEKEAAAAKERARLEAIAQAEREKAEAERKAAEEKARKEREAIELQAAKERAEAEAKARIEAEARAKAEAEAKALRDAEAKRLADEKAAAEAKAKADALAAKKAAAAPDKAKLMEFATRMRDIEIPMVKSESAGVVRNDIAAKLESFAKWIESQAATL
jgi:hypothetical protein